MAGRIRWVEWKVIISLTIFALLWILLILPVLTENPIWLTFNPILQYILLNLGFIILSIISFGIVITLLQEPEVSLGKMVKNGITSWLGISFIYDLWQPPYYIDKLGNPVFSENAEALAHATSDGMWVFIFNSIFPSMKTIIIPVLDISVLYLAVYFIVPILTVVLMALLFNLSRFKEGIFNE